MQRGELEWEPENEFYLLSSTEFKMSFIYFLAEDETSWVNLLALWVWGVKLKHGIFVSLLRCFPPLLLAQE